MFVCLFVCLTLPVMLALSVPSACTNIKRVSSFERLRIDKSVNPQSPTHPNVSTCSIPSSVYPLIQSQLKFMYKTTHTPYSVQYITLHGNFWTNINFGKWLISINIVRSVFSLSFSHLPIHITSPYKFLAIILFVCELNTTSFLRIYSYICTYLSIYHSHRALCSCSKVLLDFFNVSQPAECVPQWFNWNLLNDLHKY